MKILERWKLFSSQIKRMLFIFIKFICICRKYSIKNRTKLGWGKNKECYCGFYGINWLFLDFMYLWGVYDKGTIFQRNQGQKYFVCMIGRRTHVIMKYIWIREELFCKKLQQSKNEREGKWYLNKIFRNVVGQERRKEQIKEQKYYVEMTFSAVVFAEKFLLNHD